MYQASPCVTYCGVCSAITPKYISQCVSFTNFYPIYLDDTYLSKMSCHHKLKISGNDQNFIFSQYAEAEPLAMKNFSLHQI